MSICDTLSDYDYTCILRGAENNEHLNENDLIAFCP